MRLKIRFPLRHPFFSDWKVTPVRTALGPCTAISGNFWELLEGAAAGVTARRAVFTMLYSDTPYLSDADRQMLWEAFQVPVFGCLLDGDGRLVAYECEAQDGLHVAVDCSGETGICGEDSILGYQVPLKYARVEKAPCDCGRPGQRLRFQEIRLAAPFTRMIPAPKPRVEDALLELVGA
jgi:hypothetical protein